MKKICEICGTPEEPEKEDYSYEIMNVCPECTEHLTHHPESIDD